ncbi:hypothetical protein [Halorubrum aethiopicum]|uniref:hypothetical protein n=1 Tax=Halorubrum aethiopicum TaxID=1758255 RepID=UPI000A949E00|nr:hypothetical protein [Halorubrum aethiopicum]
MSSSESIRGFDPETDNAKTPNGGKVKRGYEKLKERGRDDAASEVRRTDSIQEQLRLIRQHPEFDPKHDEFRTSSKGDIQRVYAWLIEHGHEAEAESLRSLGTVRKQQNRVGDLKQEYDISY